MNKKEEAGFYLINASRGPMLTTTLVILFPIVLDLAKANTDSNGYVRVLGIYMRPSIFVFLVNCITSLNILILAPVVGAVSDTTRYKRRALVVMSLILFSATLLSFFLLHNRFWMVAGLIQVIIIGLFELSEVILNAFIPEIGNDEQSINKLSSFSTMVENLSIVVFLMTLPFILMYGSTRNLVTHGNFDYFNSYSSWNIMYDGKIHQCVKKANDDIYPSCSNTIELYNHGASALELKTTEAYKDIVLTQNKTRSKKEDGEYAFYTSLYSQDSNVAAALEVVQYRSGEIIDKSSYEPTSLSEKPKSIKVNFRVLKETKTISFNVKIHSEAPAKVVVEKIETILPVEIQQIISLVLSGLLFFSLTALGALFINEGAVQNELSTSRAIYRSYSITKDAICSIIHIQKIFLFIISNMLWYGGYVIWSLLLIVYLEDQFAIGSFNLAILFIILCFSNIAGAILNYYLSFYMDLWNIAKIFYFIWMFIPLLVFTIQKNIPLYINCLIVVIVGICFGVVISLRLTIFANLIPPSKEGTYMGIFFFASKFMDLIANLFILLFIKFVQLQKLIALSCIFFVIAFLVLIPIFITIRKEKLLKKHDNEKMSDVEITT